MIHEWGSQGDWCATAWAGTSVESATEEETFELWLCIRINDIYDLYA